MRPPGRSLVLAPPRQIEVIDFSVRPLQLEVGEYLVFKRKRLTAKSQKGGTDPSKERAFPCCKSGRGGAA